GPEVGHLHLGSPLDFIRDQVVVARRTRRRHQQRDRRDHRSGRDCRYQPHHRFAPGAAFHAIVERHHCVGPKKLLSTVLCTRPSAERTSKRTSWRPCVPAGAVMVSGTEATSLAGTTIAGMSPSTRPSLLPARVTT